MSRAQNRERATRGRRLLAVARDLLNDPKGEAVTMAADVLADVLHGLRPSERARAVRLGLLHFLDEVGEHVEGTGVLSAALAALQVACPECSGTGHLDDPRGLLGTETCPTCAGSGRVA